MPATSNELRPALDALDACDTALEQLDARCCDPGRSPRMQRLAATLLLARSALSRVGEEPARARDAVGHLEEAGAQVGRLQVGCCAPDRLPLYADMLRGLGTAQIALSRSQAQGH